MTSEQAAYLAGVLDGDGWITLCGPSKHLTVGTQQSDGDAEAMLQMIYDSAGGAVYPCRERLAWQVTGRAALPILREVVPFVVLKRVRVQAVLETYEDDRVACVRAFQPEEVEQVEQHMGSVREVSRYEAAYAAGFFDCEGTVGVSVGFSARGRGRPVSLNVYLSQVDCRPVVWIADRWGSNVYRRTHKGPVVGFTHASQLCGKKAIKFLRDIAPFVRLKREEVETVLAEWTFAAKGGRSEENLKRREARLVLKEQLESIRRKWKGAGGRATLRIARP